MGHRSSCAAALWVAVLTACATGPIRNLGEEGAGPPRLAVVPVEVTAPIRHLADIATPPGPEAEAKAEDRNEQAVIEARMGEVTTGLARALMDHLAGPFTLVPMFEVARAVEAAAPLPDTDRRAWLASVGRAVDADAVLYVELSGYGHIKRTWLTYLLGTGVAEGRSPKGRSPPRSPTCGSPWRSLRRRSRPRSSPGAAAPTCTTPTTPRSPWRAN